MTADNPSSSGDCPSFEDALRALEQIVHDLEEGRLGLAESLARYEDGVKLLRQCFSMLEQAERRIELLTGVDAAGNPVTTPFDDQATKEQAGQSRPHRPRRQQAKPDKPPPAEPPGIDEPGSLF